MSAHMVDERVVRVDKREVHLRHHRVRVVAGIADDRRAFGVAQHVEPVGRREELGRVLAPEQIRMAHRTVSVQALQIQLR